MRSVFFTLNDTKTKRYLITYTETFGDGPVEIKIDYDNLVDAVSMLKHVADKNPTLVEQKVIIEQTTLDITQISAAFDAGYKDKEENFERSTENVETYFGDFSKYYWEGKNQHIKDYA